MRVTMNRFNLTLLISLPLLPVACSTHRSEVATKFGYEKSSMVEAGPYELHYGQSGAKELVLLAEGNWNILSRATGQGTDIYLDGLPFINFSRSQDGSVTNLSLSLTDANGKQKITLIDKDGDGQWDLKIDHLLKKTFVWKEGQWIAR